MHKALNIIGIFLFLLPPLLSLILPHHSFLLVFMSFSGICCIIYGFLLYFEKSKQKYVRITAKYLRFTALFLILIFIITQIFIQIKIFRSIETDTQSCDYVLILGAGVKNGKPSITLKSRLDKAYEYLKSNSQTKAILCGGLGDDDLVTESCVMKNYLIGKGIDSSRLIEENKSKDTTQNIKFAKEIIGSDIDNSSIGVLTSDFHIYRSTLIMKKAGYPTCYRFPATTPDIPFLRFGLHLREYFSIILEYMNL